MAKKIIYGVGLLPSGRALRVLGVDTRRMLEINKRVGAKHPLATADMKAISINASEYQGDTECATIALCVRGITLEPVKLVTKTRAPTQEEVAAAAAAGQSSPTVIEDGIDEAATLKPYVDSQAPEFKRWTPLGEMVLDNNDENNDLSMFALFAQPREWKAALRIISQAGDGGMNGPSPFAGLVVKSSAT